jgi:hypothetical protein
MPVHLKPISRMNSAIATRSLSDFDLVMYSKRTAMDLGEFMVITVAVEIVSHGHRLSLRAVVSRSNLPNISWILTGAEVGSFLEPAVLIKAVRVGDSFITTYKIRVRQ